jgi:three-Cys-motif partner protein
LDSSRNRNSKCLVGCNKDDRKSTTDDDICKIAVSDVDGLQVRCVGEWAFKKIYHVSRLFHIFAVGMKDKWRGNTNYVEICCGPGRCINRETGMELEGSSLSIVNNKAFPFLGRAVFVDNNPQVVEALRKRIDLVGKSARVEAHVGDYNDPSGIRRVLESLPERSLNLVFVDPTDCSVPFATIKHIKESLNNVDLIVNLAIGTDLKRNLEAAILDPKFQIAKEKYTRFLGKPDYFLREDTMRYATEGNTRRLAELFFEEYKDNLRELGYHHFDALRVQHYYYLVFASGDERGLEFWKKARAKGPEGQYEFDLDV